MPRFSGGTEPLGEESIRPSTAIVPSVGSTKPASMRKVVVLPQPDGPSSERNSPSPDLEVDAVDRLEAAERTAELI